MAKQSGLIKIKGRLDDLSFYKTRDGNLVRMKGGVDGARIANDPAFIRTRENGAEFGSSATAGKLLRDTVRPMMLNAADNRVTSRLTQVMTLIKTYDTTSARGERNVGIGISDPNALQLLKGFNFNDRAVIGAVLYGSYVVNGGTGDITFAAFTPVNDLAFPAGATHVSLTSAYARIDFAAGTGAIEYSPVTNLPIDGVTTAVSLTPAAAPTGSGTRLHLLLIEFFQEVNAIQYSLKNGAYNVMAIVDAS